ncbi:hypothetical protein BASA83_010712 [Batrachochytrium salamandrivorans]|nr:hypothetical protein BASA83_010712 [Batrachochytrium salamandrivorans]
MWTGVLSHFVTPHYAGQTTQGNTDDGDGGVDQAPDSNPNPKKDTSLPQRVHSLKLTEALQKSNTPDQSDVSLSADPQPKKVCIEVKSYCQGQKADQYNAFIASEIKYFESEYSRKEELGQGAFGVVYRATRKSDGKKVAYKSIPKRNIRNYALESIPPLRCQLPSPLAPSDEPSVAQCMSPRPPNLFVPYESVLQMYLSRPGHENPYVLMALDYIILENEYILVMEYCDEKWATLAKYVEKKGPLDIRDVRDIVREVVDAMIYLKQRGIVHNDIHGRIKLIDFGMSAILPGWKEGKSVPSKF